MGFLEDNLDANQEIAFAEKLATESEFRERFKKYLILTGSLKSSSEFFPLAIRSKYHVFKTLVFSPIATGVIKPQTTKISFLDLSARKVITGPFKFW